MNATATRLLHREIAGDLMQRLVGGEFAVGSRLPAEEALAAEYGTTRSVVRTALAQLARRGHVESQRGAGWTVRSARPAQRFDQMRAFAQWAEGRGFAPGGRIVSALPAAATAREARFFRLRLGEEVLRFVRVRTLNGRLVMVERSTWAPWVAPLFTDVDPFVASTTRLLAGAGVLVVRGTHRIEVMAASSEDAALLGIRRSSPLLKVARETYSSDGRAVELGEDRYVPGVIAFEVSAEGSLFAGELESAPGGA